MARPRGFIDCATEPLPWLELLLAFFDLAFQDGRHDDAVLRQRLAARRRLILLTCLAAGLLSAVGAGLAAANGGGGGATIVLSRLLLAVGLVAFFCSLALGAFAHRLLVQGFSRMATETLALLCLIQANLVKALGGAGERAAFRRCVSVRTMPVPAAGLILCQCLCLFRANGGGIIMRWKRVLQVRALLLLAFGVMATNCFLALEAAADKVLGEGFVYCFGGSVRAGCAILAAATHLPLARAAIFGV